MGTSKLEKMQRFVPSLYKPQTNTNVRGLLYAWASEDDAIVEAIKNAREQIFVTSAQLSFLNSLGSNVGVFRPTAMNLSDILYRRLIPALSFHPKQVISTIWTVLDIFFGEDNPRVLVHEINTNQIEIQIPSSIPALRRDLRGAQHFHNYSGEIISVDNVSKEIVIEIEAEVLGSLKEVKVEELENALFGSGDNVDYILSNTAGNTSTLQFSAVSDLSVFTAGERFIMAVPTYQGSFIPDTTSAFTTTKNRGLLGQIVTTGSIVPSLIMQDASNIPDDPGYIVFNFGKPNEESLVRYFGRPNNTTLLLDPAYNFLQDHAVGEWVNVIETPYQRPSSDGLDYSVYLVGVTAARILAQQIIESIIAAGIVINWTIIGPEINC